MEILDVPEVRQDPELSANQEGSIAFADRVLTSLLGYDCAVLRAEHNATDSSVVWRLEPREDSSSAQVIEIATSPDRGSFRAVLARFGHHYMGGQLYNGYAFRWLRQGNRVHRCYIYMSNGGQPGFWIRVYAALVFKEGAFRDLLPPAHGYFLSDVRLETSNPTTAVFKAKLSAPEGKPVWARAWLSTEEGTLVEAASPQLKAGDDVTLEVTLKTSEPPQFAYLRIESAPLQTEHVVVLKL